MKDVRGLLGSRVSRRHGLPVECAILLLHIWLPLTVGAIAFSGEHGQPAKAGELSTKAVSKTQRPQTTTSANALSADVKSFEARYHKIWKYVKKHFLYAKRLANWHEWEHRFDGKLKDRKDFDNAVSAMLASLNDDFTYMRSKSIRKGVASSAVPCAASQDLEYRMLDRSIGYLKLRAFYDDGLPEKMMCALGSMKHAKCYVLDLRDNKGGVIDIAFEAFGLLANEGVFTMYRGNNDYVLYDNQDMLLTTEAKVRVRPDHSRIVEGRLPNLTLDKPIVVIVDENTRSAAEMLAGALRDERGAVVIGSRTFGKGILQDVLPCDEESDIKVTSARFFLPSGEFIHELGITPDYYVASDQNQIPSAVEIAQTLTTQGKENPPL